MITWIIAGILATIGGALYGLDKSFKPFTYFNNIKKKCLQGKKTIEKKRFLRALLTS